MGLNIHILGQRGNEAKGTRPEWVRDAEAAWISLIALWNEMSRHKSILQSFQEKVGQAMLNELYYTIKKANQNPQCHLHVII